MLALSACVAKHIYMPDEWEATVDLRFYWDSVPSQPVAGMTTIFYPIGSGQIYRFDSAGSDSATVRLRPGIYNVLCYNSDAYNVRMRDTENFDAIYATTDGDVLRQVPQTLWSDAAEGIEIADCCCCCEGEGSQVITLRPTPLLPLYTVTIRGQNADAVARGVVTLGGLAPGCRMVSRDLLAGSVVMQTAVRPIATNTIYGQFTPFGHAEGAINNLTLSAKMKDGTTVSHSFDVTEQIISAPEPNVRVDIVIEDVDFPLASKPDSIAPGLFDPEVDGWKYIDIFLRQ